MCAAALSLVAIMAAPFHAWAGQLERVTVTGEVIDPWCYLSEIMWATGSAHHQCAIWCARGGIPVGILGDDEQVYIVLQMDSDPDVIGHHGILRMQSNEVVVEGDLYVRDNINYLAIDTIIDDHGIVNYSHDEFEIQPFGD
jgi:hypothetical protein